MDSMAVQEVDLTRNWTDAPQTQPFPVGARPDSSTCQTTNDASLPGEKS